MTNYVPKKPRDFDDPAEVAETLSELYEWRPELRHDISLYPIQRFSRDIVLTGDDHPSEMKPFSKLYLSTREGFQRLDHLVKLMEYDKRHGQSAPIRNSSLACCGG